VCVAGGMYPAKPGELIETSFVASAGEGDEAAGPVWTLTMKIVGDASRVSTLRVEQPYMGVLANDKKPTSSWAEVRT
jgi:hypothetical protein